MPAGRAQLEIDIFSNGRELFPLPGKFTFADHFATAGNKLTVNAGATDVTVPITGSGTIAAVVLWDDVGVTGNSLTVKVNGSSDELSVKPFLVLSEDITSLTVSNSDADNGKVLNWSLFTS